MKQDGWCGCDGMRAGRTPGARRRRVRGLDERYYNASSDPELALHARAIPRGRTRGPGRCCVARTLGRQHPAGAVRHRSRSRPNDHRGRSAAGPLADERRAADGAHRLRRRAREPRPGGARAATLPTSSARRAESPRHDYVVTPDARWQIRGAQNAPRVRLLFVRATRRVGWEGHTRGGPGDSEVKDPGEGCRGGGDSE